MPATSHTPSSNVLRPAFLSLWLIASVSFTGCSAMIGRSKGPLDNIDAASIKAAGYTMGAYGTEKPLVSDHGEECIVLDITDGKRHMEKLPVQPGQSLFVADIIRDADLHKKIGRMKLSVLRPNGKNRPPVRMDVDFDDSGRHVMEGQNYSLRPGDHLVIRRDERPLMGNFFK